MTELPEEKKIYSFDLYQRFGPGFYSEDIPVEWGILAAASDKCLLGRVRGWLETEIVREITGNLLLWRLWNQELGEMGTFEVRKIGPGRSQITFSGLGFVTDKNGLPLNIGDEMRGIKERHMRDIKNAYFFALSRANIFHSDIEEEQKEATSAAEEWQPEKQPWEYIQEIKENVLMVKLWCQGAPIDEIAEKTLLATGTIYNRLGLLRKKYERIPEAHIPEKDERRKMRHS